MKHKFIAKFQLEDIDLCGFSNLSRKVLLADKDFLEEDLNTITRINELVKHIIFPHQVSSFSLNGQTIKSNK